MNKERFVPPEEGPELFDKMRKVVEESKRLPPLPTSETRVPPDLPDPETIISHNIRKKN